MTGFYMRATLAFNGVNEGINQFNQSSDNGETR